MMRNHGWGIKKDVSRIKGMNSRLDELQAAVLRAKLPLLDRWNEKRRALAAVYDGYLEGYGCVTPPNAKGKKATAACVAKKINSFLKKGNKG